MNISVISRNIGIALVFNAFFMFLGVGVSVLYDFDSSFSPLFLSAVITLTTGLFPLIFVNKGGDISIREGLTIIVFSWALSCLFGMLPYVLWGGEFSLINAWFESVSGYTTTGATILTDIESLPKGLIFWRSSTHFIGGIGVVIFMLLILPTVSTFRMRLSKMEISALSKENYQFRTKQTITVIGSVYLGLNVLTTLSLKLAGMDWFDAVNHGFSISATGGFSTRSESILAFHSRAVDWVTIGWMIIAGLHFGLLYAAVTGNPRRLFRHPVTRFYLATLLLGTLMVMFDLKLGGQAASWGTALREGMFQVVAYATTTGFAVSDTSVWPPLSVLVLMYLSFQCACSGSTTGGLKADRIFIFCRSFVRQLKRQLHPNAVLPVRMGNQTLEPDMVESVNLFIVAYVVIIFIMAVLVSLTGVGLLDSFSSSLASMGNVGPGFGSIGSLDSYHHFPVMAKFLLTLEMFLGRLEIYSFLLIFTLFKWK